jgi:tetratricopeptide (TPR) repeat protein
LQERPNYAYALAGLGRLEKANKNYDQAIAYLEKARQSVIDYAFNDQITDIYQLAGQPVKALESAQRVIAELSGKDHLGSEEDGSGHYADRELAYAYLKTGQYDLALKHAQIEYERRPQNIDVNETLAWVQYKRGAYTEADRLMTVALRTSSQNPVLLYRAGLIRMKNGQTESGRNLLRQALTVNPHLPDLLTEERQAFLALK